ncbi:glycoside hydrolase family 2 TIM barrel-domain containing protein [uncultured Duncaniella sp.]|uniref:glycoside hydrolase family 2 TIM barrel-domain containing protein n=1 Tax=uncultured Duncaniella sp. TaxID=2768039 RepID=UPI002AAF3E69|nr:glycoside hydrolase family 2 TIM barrel-domain containing protein [uncultured Duncaniella sp.]
MMNRFLAILGLSCAFSFTCQADSREVENINFGWRFSPGEIEAATTPDFDDSRWQTVNLPHDFQISQPWVAPAADEKADKNNSVANVSSRLSSRGFKEMGTGWYRRQLVADPSWKGKRVLLDFGGIMLNGDVYFNGKPVGGTDYGYLGFEIDVTRLINFDEPNVIAVRADTGKPENSRWYTGGGLYRDVNVVVTDPDMYFTRHPLYVTTPVVGTDKASVKLQAEIAALRHKGKTLTVNVKISDADGAKVYERTIELPFRRKQKVNEYTLDSLTIDNPRLWDCENPHLYTVELSLLSPEGKELDNVKEQFGIRSIEYSPEFGLKLNGKKTLLKGIANHHTLGALGAAAYPAAIEKRIKMLKDFGFNHIRTSHNPYSKEFMELCDRYGILVVDELYDKWLTQYAGGRKDWMQQWPKDVPEWVKRDRNHPSVVMWSLGNELQLLWNLPYADWGVTPYKMQKVLLDRYDTTRPVTVAMHPRGRDLSTDSLPAPLVLETDIAAYNYRYMYFPGDSRRFPWMMFYQSEANTSGMGPNFYEMNLDKVIGLAYWGMIDYLGESHGWPAKGWTEGIFDISLEPKPIAWFLRSIFKPEEPIVHIGIIDSDDNTVWNDVQVGTKRMSEHWNRKPGSTADLYTYTNGDEVELLLNGKSLGKKRNEVDNPKNRNRILWENIPYKAGALEAVAYRDGKKIATHRIETAGKVAKLRAEGDNQSWKADGMDLQHVKIEALDSKSRIVPGTDTKLTFKVDGPAEIVGVINGNLSSDEMMTGNTRSLYNGRASVILRSTDEAGPVTLTITPENGKEIRYRMNTI